MDGRVAGSLIELAETGCLAMLGRVTGAAARVLRVDGRLVAGFLVVCFLVVTLVVVVDLVAVRVVAGRLAVVLVVELVAGFVLALAAFLAAVLMVGTEAGETGADRLARLEDKPSIDLFFSIVYNYSIMAIKLTKKQLALLNFLEDFTEENGHSPSYREIMAGLGLTSVSAVAEHVDNLVAKGVLEKVPGEARSLRILNYKNEETVELFKAKLMDCSDEEKTVLEKAAQILDIDIS